MPIQTQIRFLPQVLRMFQKSENSDFFSAVPGNNFGIFWTAYYNFLEKEGYTVVKL